MSLLFCESFSSFAAWISTNKEWLFSGAGLVVISGIGAIFWNLYKGPKSPQSADTSTTIERASYGITAASSSLARVTSSFCGWLIGRMNTIRKRHAEKKQRSTRQLYNAMRESTVFFSDRFAAAFPGCRDIVSIDDAAEAVHRLDILLRRPISIEVSQKGGSVRATPIWWFRGHGNLHIDSYTKIRKYFFLSTNDIILNGVELHRVRRIVALGSMAYWATAVYVETDGVPPSGLYKYGFSKHARGQDYESEEVGVYKWNFIKRDEYDDGEAIIKGKVVNVRKKAKLQIRYVTSYNFLIAPAASPINDSRCDAIFEDALNALLKRDMTVRELADLVRKLPRNPREDFM